MKAAMLIALVAAVSVTTAYAAEPAKQAPMGDKGMSMQMMDKCEGMKIDGKAGAKDMKGANDGKAMNCPKDGMSDEHMKQMHEHMQEMHGDAGMMGKEGMGGMPAGAANEGAAPSAATKPAAAAPADAVDHAAHHPQ